MHARGALRLASGRLAAVSTNGLSPRAMSTSSQLSKRYKKPHKPNPYQWSSQGVAPRVYLMHTYKPPPLQLDVALRALRAYSFAEEPEAVNLTLQCNMIMKNKKSLQPFRAAISYPHKFGRLQRILFIGEDDESMRSARESGADIVGGPETIEKIKSGELSPDEFDTCLCSPLVYDEVKKCSIILKTKTPSPRKGTVIATDSIAEGVSQFQQTFEYRVTSDGLVSLPVGQLDHADSNVAANVKTLVDSVLANKSTSMSPKKFIKKAVLSSTLGPKFDVAVLKLAEPHL